MFINLDDNPDHRNELKQVKHKNIIVGKHISTAFLFNLEPVIIVAISIISMQSLTILFILWEIYGEAIINKNVKDNCNDKKLTFPLLFSIFIAPILLDLHENTNLHYFLIFSLIYDNIHIFKNFFFLIS